jgi:hypothetical protein
MVFSPMSRVVVNTTRRLSPSKKVAETLLIISTIRWDDATFIEIVYRVARESRAVFEVLHQWVGRPERDRLRTSAARRRDKTLRSGTSRAGRSRGAEPRSLAVDRAQRRPARSSTAPTSSNQRARSRALPPNHRPTIPQVLLLLLLLEATTTTNEMKISYKRP